MLTTFRHSKQISKLELDNLVTENELAERLQSSLGIYLVLSQFIFPDLRLKVYAPLASFFFLKWWCFFYFAFIKDTIVGLRPGLYHFEVVSDRRNEWMNDVVFATQEWDSQSDPQHFVWNQGMVVYAWNTVPGSRDGDIWGCLVAKQSQWAPGSVRDSKSGGRSLETTSKINHSLISTHMYTYV